MDPLSDVLDASRARDAFLLRVVMAAPWSICVEDEAPLSVVAQVQGRSWVRSGAGPSVPLETGDVLLVRGTEPYTMSSDDAGEPTIRVGGGQACSGADGRDLSAELACGVRTWGNDPRGQDVLLVGSYRRDSEAGRLLLDALPSFVVVAAPAPAVVDLLVAELERQSLGQATLLDRLLDLLLVTTIRVWVATGGGSGTWLSAGRDAVVQQALDLLHERPEHPWTLDELAAGAGVSRATLARRFREAVGTPPMAYLSRWRLARAADLLDDPSMTLATVARRVGYADAFSLSTAFKRANGISPADHRRRASQHVV